MFKKNLLVFLFLQAFSLCATTEVAEKKPADKQESTKSSSPSAKILRLDKDFCLQILSDEHTNINETSPSGKTPLQLLALYFINNFHTEQLIALSLKRGANANICDELGRTPLFFLVAYALCPEMFVEKQKELDDSVTSSSKKAFVNEESKKDSAVEKSSSPDLATTADDTKSSRNPLHDRTLTMAVIELLLSFSADPTIADHDGISPLLLAISVGDQEMVELFARYGLLEKIFQEEQSEEKNTNLAETVVA